ncbi:ankyrin repeat [Anaeramoeba ignava]|uniref:Ankyrin repeat n=1 Tax=Anaeramoeba ignava TaxID=1746090 RepID=A0A9Q0LHP1_ANAIG|nr:ankyrin repeat [Anaeramoeba ignava]
MGLILTQKQISMKQPCILLVKNILSSYFWTALHLLCGNSYLSSKKNIAYLVEKGIDIHARTIDKGLDVNEATNQHQTHLYIFALLVSNALLDVVEYLIEKGADINVRAIQNETLLHVACQNNSFEIIKLLVQNGIDINARNTILMKQLCI